MKKRSKAQLFHAMREFEDVGSLAGIVTRLGQIARHKTTLVGEASELYKCVDILKSLLDNWKASTEISRMQFMKGD